MRDDQDSRAIELGRYICLHGCTVRAAALRFGLGKSTVHKDVTDRLYGLDRELYERVREVLDYNLSVRHLRGGEATRQNSLKRRHEQCGGGDRDVDPPT